MNWPAFSFFFGYLFLFILCLAAAIWCKRRWHRTRFPLPESWKLLRMPGEHLWQRINKSDEDGFIGILIAMLLPLLVFWGALQIVARFGQGRPKEGLAAAAAAFIVSLLLSLHWILRTLRRRANDYLGFFGERYVAEFLDPLKAEGWFIFHDVPCEGATGKFNLDHVAVGRGGLWVVETKTRRKGRARPGLKGHEVIFEGGQLVWPWGESRAELKQALNNARWLENWLQQVTGKKYQALSVIAFPGWNVVPRQLEPVRVVTASKIRDVLTSHSRALLSPEDVDLIRRQLDQRCRTVEY